MKLIEEHIKYLKDNPEGYWFKRKLYGYGWTPATTAGWLVVGVYVVFLFGVMLYVQSHSEEAEFSNKIVLIILAATILLIAISWRTGEPLKWQWGRKDKKTNE